LTDHELPPPSELLAEFALGVLPEADAARVQAYLAENAEAMSEFEEMARVARLLPFAADDREPSVDLRTSIMDRITREAGSPFQQPGSDEKIVPLRSRHVTWPLVAAAAAILVVAAGIGGFVLGNSGRREDTEIRAQAVRQANLLVAVAHGQTQSFRGVDGNTSVSVVRASGSLDAYTYVEGLPPLPRGKAYQAWFTRDFKEFEPGPVFSTNTGGVWLSATDAVDGYAALAFTIENDSGVKTPSQAPFVVVPLQVTAKR
jgi:hypothetical protein